MAVSDIILAIAVIVLNPQTSIIYQYDIQQDCFWTSFFITISSYLLVGMNLDRALAIKKPFNAANQSNEKTVMKILVCCFLAFIPGGPYLFDDTVTKCKIENPEKWCWPPIDNVTSTSRKIFKFSF